MVNGVVTGSRNGPAGDDAGEAAVGVLLAGGKSRRMGGGDKCLLKLGDKTLLEHVKERLAPQVPALILNANGDAARFRQLGLPVVPDCVEGFAGPLAGILSGMMWTREHRPGANFIVTAASDTPFFPENLVELFLAEAGSSTEAIVLAAHDERLHPVFGLWPVCLAGDLDQSLRQGLRKVLDWTEQHDQRTVSFPKTKTGTHLVDPFFNTNRPDELLEAEKILERANA